MAKRKKPLARAAYKNKEQVYSSTPSLHFAISVFEEFALFEGFGRIDVIADGLVHRFKPNGQLKGKNGYYCFYPDGYPAGYIGDFKNDRYLTWHYKSDKPLNTEQQAEIKRNMQKMREERLVNQQARYTQGRVSSNNIWNNGVAASLDHPYLVRKCCKEMAQYLRQDQKGNLLIPLYKRKQLVGVQYINQHGGKFFAKNIELKGSYFVIGNLKKHFDLVFVVEGVSSGWAVHVLSDNAPVFCAMNAGNLALVARAIRKKWTNIRIIIAADNDVREDKTAINTGVKYANEAARVCGGRVAIPQMLDGSKCDWNDLYCLALNGGGSNE